MNSGRKKRNFQNEQQTINDQKMESRKKIKRNYLISQQIDANMEQKILSNFPNLYTFLKLCNNYKFDDILSETKDSLVSQYQKQHLINIIKYMDENYRHVQLMRITKAELLATLYKIINTKCSFDNFFIQDLFNPSRIFKSRYVNDPYSDIFMTSFYYILNCEYKKIPLKTKKKSNNKFPLDVDISEFDRPCVLVDVANQFYDKGSFDGRVQFLKKHIFAILNDFFSIHTEPDILIIFVHQGDLGKQFNCPEIYSVAQWDFRVNSLLQEDRKAIYISVPCNLFLYPEINYPSQTRFVERNFRFNTGEEPGYPNNYSRDFYRPGYYYNTQKLNKPFTKYRQEIKNIYYDRYGRMLSLSEDNRGKNHMSNFIGYDGNHYFDMVNIPYYQYNPVEIHKNVFKTSKMTDPYGKRHASKKPGDVFQGMNKFQNFVSKNSACAKAANISKNEIDDYMIGILLCIYHKLTNECNDDFVPFRPRWILFTLDNYNWINPEILKNVHKEKDFLLYCQNPPAKPYQLYQRNPKSDAIIEKLGLNPYTDQLSDFTNLMKTIIKVNK